jgi:hypothetical protein
MEVEDWFKPKQSLTLELELGSIHQNLMAGKWMLFWRREEIGAEDTIHRILSPNIIDKIRVKIQVSWLWFSCFITF